MAEPGAPQRFPCTAAGAVARGRRRLLLLLASPALAMVAVAVAVAVAGRWVPALLALAVAALAALAWRMSGDLEPLWLELAGGELTVQTRGRRIGVPLPADAARRLHADEVGHLERLASAGGVVAGSGGFDSHRLGEFELYASDLAHAVLVESGDSRLVVTPDDPEAFLAALPRRPGGDSRSATIPVP